jgi:hypothetical protein
MLFCAAKVRAIKKGVPFDLDFKFFKTLDVTRCAATGVRLSMAATGRMQMDGPSLDRVDPAQGYVKSNVRVVANLVNVCKNSWSESDPEFLALLDKYVEFIRTKQAGISDTILEASDTDT